jgi:hypothetical protein
MAEDHRARKSMTLIRHGTMLGQICCKGFARASERNSLSGRATWLVGLPANLRFGRIGRVVCVARSNASAIEWPREFRQQCVVSA